MKKVLIILILAEVILNQNYAQGPGSGNSFGTFIDNRDNQEYKWVQIGRQKWMAENLNFASENGSWCYDNSPQNCELYGRLYNHNAALNACPPGWHLPSKEEWKKLGRRLGFNKGGKLKDPEAWSLPEKNRRRGIQFNALPTGYSEIIGSGDQVERMFRGLGDSTDFWTSTEFTQHSLVVRIISRLLFGKDNSLRGKGDGSAAYQYGLVKGSDWMFPGIYSKSSTYSVRCTKD
jgi:uncharacterized protein (TIGR02145 family)